MIKRQPRPDEILNRLQSVVQDMPKPDPDAGLVLPDRFGRLLAALATINVWVCEFDDAGRMIYSGPNATAIVGFTPEECIRDSVEFHPDDLPIVRETSTRVRTTRKPAHSVVRIRHRQGHWVWFDASVLGWQPSEGADFHTITIGRDISDLKHAEAAREESETRRRAISQMSEDLISEVDEEGRLTYIAPGCEEVIGYTADEALAIEPWSIIHPDDSERVQARLQQEFGAGRLAVEVEPRKRPAIECRLRHRDGRWVWLETNGLPYKRADGEIRFLAVSRDVTERRGAEETRRKFEERLQRAQRLEGLGVLAGGIAHDFNNLLTPILGAARLALEDLPPESPVRRWIERIEQAARRASALTNQMLSYAGQSPLRIERIDFSKLVGEMRDLVGSSVSGKTSFELDLPDGLPAIEAEPAQISQLVMNLVTNAVESQRDGVGRITVRTGVVDVEAPPAEALFAEAMNAGRHVYLEVSDAGVGMDEETRARIFDPFFTTKFTGRGLGLAAVAGIVRAHRGAIEVESAPGAGTRFRVLLPAVDGRVAKPRAGAEPIRGWRTTGIALVIDDDQGVRELAEDVLRRAGMTVLSGSDGHQGMKLFELHANAIRVVLLDRTMPALSGADTFDAIRAVRPETKIILVSGYSEERVAEELASRGPSLFLQKPFTPEALLTRVRDALEGLG